MSAVATHFASSLYVSDIVYIRGMMGKGGETMPCGPDAWNSTTVGMVVNGGTATTCHAAYDSWWNSGGYIYDYGFWEDWLYYRLGDEEADFSYAFVVASVDNWDNNQLKWPCSYPGTGTCDYHNYWIYEAVSGNLGSNYQTVVGSNALPHDTGQIRELDDAIATNYQSSTNIVHYEFQESAQAPDDGTTTTEATTAWCFSESDPDVTGQQNDMASVEWYKSDWTNGYTTGITDFPSWEDGTTDPGSDGTVCSGL